MSEAKNEMIKEIRKSLSANDIGLTGGHQAGILVPKNKDVLSFFPGLPNNSLNPRVRLTFKDSSGKNWFFNFIYYNNRLFGGTRNEYRLTGMTSYMRENNLCVDDQICFSMNEQRDRFISYQRKNKLYTVNNDVITVLSSWTIFN